MFRRFKDNSQLVQQLKDETETRNAGDASGRGLNRQQRVQHDNHVDAVPSLNLGEIFWLKLDRTTNGGN